MLRKVIHQRSFKLVTKIKLLTFIALVVGTANNLLMVGIFGEKTGIQICQPIRIGNYMNRTRFFKIKSIVHFMIEDKSSKDLMIGGKLEILLMDSTKEEWMSYMQE